MLEIYSIEEYIRVEAENIGKQRDQLAQEHRRKSRFVSRPSPEVNWQGAIAELKVRRIYPRLRLSQPIVLRGSKIAGSDFLYEGGIEIKCNLFKNMYDQCLVNVAAHRDKGHLSKTVIFTGINNVPEKAMEFYIFGWIPTEELEKCTIWPKGSRDGKIKDDCYAVPRKIMAPMKELFDFMKGSLSSFMKERKY